MVEETRGVWSAYRFAWRTFWSRPFFWFSLMVLVYASFSGGGVDTSGLESEYGTREVGDPSTNETDTADAIPEPLMVLLLSLVGIVGVVMFVVAIYFGIRFSIGHLSINLLAVDGKSPQYADVFANGELFWRFLGALVLYMVSVLLGLAIFILPGIYILSTYSFFGYALVDKNYSIWDALKASAEISKGHRLQIVGFFLLQFLFYIFGILVLFVGFFAAVAISNLAFAHLYRSYEQGRDQSSPASA